MEFAIASHRHDRNNIATRTSISNATVSERKSGWLDPWPVTMWGKPIPKILFNDSWQARNKVSIKINAA